MMKPSGLEKRYQELASKWLDNTITDEEKLEFSHWYNSGQDKPFEMPDGFSSGEEALRERILLNIEKGILPKENAPSRITHWYRYVAAALVLFILATGLFFLNRPANQLVKVEPSPLRGAPLKQSSPAPQQKQITLNDEQHDIPAGKDKAVLTLGDGTRIILDDAQNGILAKQGGRSILKTSNGELIYAFSQAIAPAAPMSTAALVSYNTIETPKGGKFQVKLPDGSKVWLNAASSLRFPIAFSGSKREVHLKGEAYFEVAPDSMRVFEVITRNQKVQVLGTHFNINAYGDEPTVNTTLLEGSVKISDLRTNASQLLKPGEQSILSESIEIVNVDNVEKSVAWKDGYFQFYESDIQTVMRQIGRWYDVDVRYEGEIPHHRFGGEIERSLSLLQVLKILEKTQVHFRLEGKEVIVMP